MSSPRKPRPRKSDSTGRHAAFSAKALDVELARLKRIARKPGVIPDIHNYCDRWCERCPQTARCASADTKKPHTLAARERSQRQPEPPRQGREQQHACGDESEE